MGGKQSYDCFWLCSTWFLFKFKLSPIIFTVVIQKNYIEVSGIVYSGKVLTRSYVPTISADEYAAENINGIVNNLLSSNILLHYVETENDIETIIQLQKKLEERKKFLERKRLFQVLCKHKKLI